jgi:hypothetical protein
VLNTWLIWWNAHEIPLTSRWWNPPTFHPLPGVLALSEHLLGLAPLTSPIQWLGASPLAAYNVAFLLSFLLSAAAAYWLVLSLTLRHDAAFIAGLGFGFAPYRMSQLAHLQVICSYLMPVALMALHRYVAEGRRRWLVVFGLSWLLQSLTQVPPFYFGAGGTLSSVAARPPTSCAGHPAPGPLCACLVSFLASGSRQLGPRAGFETTSAPCCLAVRDRAFRFWKLPFRLRTRVAAVQRRHATLALAVLAQPRLG